MYTTLNKVFLVTFYFTLICLSASLKALGGTGNSGEDWKSTLIKEAGEKLRLRMEQNSSNERNGLSINNSYLIELKGASSKKKKYVGDWLDERGESERLFSDMELSELIRLCSV